MKYARNQRKISSQVVDGLQELAAYHPNAPHDLIAYLTQTAETLMEEERCRTEPETVSTCQIFASSELN